MAVTYDKIATTTLSSAASSITFSSIPATYTDLRIIFRQLSSSNQSVLWFNSDTANNYSYTTMYGSGTSTGSYNGSLTIPLHVGSGTNTFYTVDLFSYTGSIYKSVLTTLNEDSNGSGYVGNTVGLWRSTSAINTIQISSNGSGNYSVGTIATLYGILKA